MKKITNRLLCALILLCAFGVFVGCQQEPETKPGTSINSPSIVGTWMYSPRRYRSPSARPFLSRIPSRSPRIFPRPRA